MKPKTMILMIVAVGCGLGASIMTSRLLAERRDKDQGEPTVPVLVTKARITGWTEMKEPEKLFEIKEFPVSLAPKAPIGELEKVKGKKLNKNVVEGYALTEADMLNKEQQSIDVQLLPGQRATAIKVDARSLAGGYVFPGTRVDILMTSKANGKGTSKTILQHVLVMAVDAQSERNAEMKHMLGNTVTVAANPTEAARLALAGSLGELTLHVKGPGDTARIAPIVVREEDLDRPITSGPDKTDEVAKADAPVIPTISLPPVVEDKGPPKDDKTPPKADTSKVVATVEPAKKSRHVMTIITSANREKHLFMLGEKDPDEDDGDAKPAGKADASPGARPAGPGRAGAKTN
jgi:Flp pilus assembly protein CpaB